MASGSPPPDRTERAVRGQGLGRPQPAGRLHAPGRRATELFAVAFSPDGEYLVTGRANRTVQVWDARTGRPIGPPLGTHGRPIRGLVFSRDGRHLASASGDGVVKLWDGPTRLGDKQEPAAPSAPGSPGSV